MGAHDFEKGKHDKVEGQPPVDKAEGKGALSPEQAYKEFQKMLSDSKQDSQHGAKVENGQLELEPAKYGNQGSQKLDYSYHQDQFDDFNAKHSADKLGPSDMTQGFIPPNEWSEKQQQILEENLQPGGFVPKYVQDEMEKRQKHPHAVNELERLKVDESMKWGKGAPDIDPTIYQGDAATLMNKINDFRGGVDGIANDLMKCMMSESVLGKNGDGLKQIEKLAKEFGMDDKQILEMATKVKEALKKMGVSTNMSVLNTFIEDHGGPGERSLNF